MDATIVAVGTELLFGQIVNTNAAYISRELQSLGVNVLYHHTVGDNEARMRDVFIRALAESDLVIASGGLGPTQDDMTKEVIADVAGAPLEPDGDALAQIESFFAGIGREMTENNRKQAMLPRGATIFYNPIGTAPGFALETSGKTVMALPGPPSELTAMFERSVVPYLAGKTDSVIYHRMLRFYGIGESQLETDLAPLITGQTDPTFATYAKEGECSLRIASKRPTRAEAEAAVRQAEQQVLALTGDCMYSDADEDMSAVAARLLIASGLTLASAESCTGGLFAATLISHPGASAAFDRGFITYSNASKTGELGVQDDLLEKNGAVSEEAATAMAKGCLLAAGTDIAISVTGVAGPDGGTKDNPVGLAWMAIADKHETITRRIETRDRGRNVNRRIVVLAMFNMLRKYLISKSNEQK
jgi:nicotinamide-nucleotide amidase